MMGVGALGAQATLNYQMQAWAAPSVTQRPLLASGCRTTSTGVNLSGVGPFRQRLLPWGAPGSRGELLVFARYSMVNPQACPPDPSP
jgi:hypothetical protein